MESTWVLEDRVWPLLAPCLSPGFCSSHSGVGGGLHKTIAPQEFSQLNRRDAPVPPNPQTHIAPNPNQHAASLSASKLRDDVAPYAASTCPVRRPHRESAPGRPSTWG